MTEKINFKISHKYWENTLKDLHLSLTMASPGDVISVVGASRTGKSRLIKSTIDMITPPQYGPGDRFGNCLYMRVMNGGRNGTFCSKFFYWNLLSQLKHPVYSEKLGVKDLASMYSRTSEAALHAAFMKAIEYLPILYIFLDEAQHVKYTPNAKIGPHAVMDAWKTMAEEANIVLVLTGSYYLLDIMKGSGHLLGREDTILMPRYSSSNDDLNEYAAIIHQIEKKLPDMVITESLTKYTRFIQEYSFGCIGLLRIWMIRAYKYSRLNNKTIDIDVLIETRPTDQKLKTIGEEIHYGEMLLRNDGALSQSEEIYIPSGKKIKKSSIKPFKVKPRRYETNNRGEFE